jgi:hypothetical protein
MSTDPIVAPDPPTIEAEDAVVRDPPGAVGAIPLPWLLLHFIRCVEKPSWEEVEEYLRGGKNRDQVETYLREHPEFEEVLRWMRNEVEEEKRQTPIPARPDADKSRPPRLAH